MALQLKLINDILNQLDIFSNKNERISSDHEDDDNAVLNILEEYGFVQVGSVFCRKTWLSITNVDEYFKIRCNKVYFKDRCILLAPFNGKSRSILSLASLETILSKFVRRSGDSKKKKRSELCTASEAEEETKEESKLMDGQIKNDDNKMRNEQESKQLKSQIGVLQNLLYKKNEEFEKLRQINRENMKEIEVLKGKNRTYVNNEYESENDSENECLRKRPILPKVVRERGVFIKNK